MNSPDIQVIKNHIYIDGKSSLKKYMDYWSHCRGLFYNDRYFVKTSFLKDDERSSFKQSIQEANVWKSLDEKDKKYFAPFVKIYKRKGIIVFERIFPTSHKRSEKALNIICRLSRKYSLEDVIGQDRNWVMVDRDHPVILDYGSKNDYNELYL